MDKNNYNFLASYYVFIRTLVFGFSTEMAYEYYLNYVGPGNSVLIVGGGAGKILLNKYLSDGNVYIDYVDSSAKMIELARRKKTSANISFICNNILTFKSDKKYDVIVLPFVLDVFNEPNLISVINIIEGKLNKGGVLVVTDFAPPSNAIQKLLLRLMFLFFRITTNIESKMLLKIENYLNNTHLKQVGRIDFQKGFIFSAVYKNV